MLYNKTIKLNSNDIDNKISRYLDDLGLLGYLQCVSIIYVVIVEVHAEYGKTKFHF